MPNWGEVLTEIADQQAKGLSAHDIVRRRYLAKLSEHTGRNTIAYYSGWQSKPGLAGTEIRDEDRDGFMRAIHEIKCSDGLDLLIHTPGGSIAAAQLQRLNQLLHICEKNLAARSG